MKLSLSFDSGDHALFVHRFVIEEAMSTPFTVKLFCRSPDPSIDLSATVGHPLRFVVEPEASPFSPEPKARIYSGLCTHMVERETPDPTVGMTTIAAWVDAGKPPISIFPPESLSTYEVTLRPLLWKLSQNQRARLFQHVSIPDMVDAILGAYHLTPEWRIDRPSYPKLELRTQYFESDLRFLTRLLEEAGIAYRFRHEGDAEQGESVLILDERPQAGDVREPPLVYRDNVGSVLHAADYITETRLSNEVRQGKYAYRDYDFRNPDAAQEPSKQGEVTDEQAYERYEYRLTQSLAEGGTPDKAKNLDVLRDYGMAQVNKVKDKVLERGQEYVVNEAKYLVGRADNAATLNTSLNGLYEAPSELELLNKADDVLFGGGTTPVADDRGVARFQASQSDRSAQVSLDAMRLTKWQLAYATNAVDLSPGSIFTIVDHPSARLDPKEKLLVDEVSIDCELGKATTVTGRAVFASAPYRPVMKTPKPRVHGVQSAKVVAPAGLKAKEILPGISRNDVLPENNEIYVDEYSRVRVQMVWDRETHADSASAWMRVSQGWAGQSYGVIAIPRVGHEVLVAFLDGDPDDPIIVGRVYNKTQPVPHALAEHKTVSTWKTHSSPGGGNFNELRLEDQKDREMVFLQSGKDYVHYTKHDDRTVIGQHRATVVKQLDAEVIGKDKTTIVGEKQSTVVLGNEVGIVGGDRIDLVGMNETRLVGAKWSVRVARGVTKAVRDGVEGLKADGAPLKPFFADSLEPTLGQIPARPLNGTSAWIARLAAAPMNFINAGKGALKKLVTEPIKAEIKPRIPPALTGIVESPVNKLIESGYDAGFDATVGDNLLKPLTDRLQELTSPVAAWGQRLSEGPISVLPELCPEPIRRIVAAAYKEIPKVKLGSGGADDPGEIGPPPTELSLAEDHIELTTGQASIILDGPNITLVAKGTIRIQAEKHVLIDSQTGNLCLAAEKDLVAGAKAEVKIVADGNASLTSTGGETILRGGPNVQINPPEEA